MTDSAPFPIQLNIQSRELLEEKIHAADVSLAKNIADVLERHYPGHLWCVNVDSRQGGVMVKNLALSDQWGFVLHIDALDPMLKKVVRAGGELLERWNIRRGKYQKGDYDHVRVGMVKNGEVQLK